MCLEHGKLPWEFGSLTYGRGSYNSTGQALHLSPSVSACTGLSMWYVWAQLSQCFHMLIKLVVDLQAWVDIMFPRSAGGRLMIRLEVRILLG